MYARGGLAASDKASQAKTILNAGAGLTGNAADDDPIRAWKLRTLRVGSAAKNEGVHGKSASRYASLEVRDACHITASRLGPKLRYPLMGLASYSNGLGNTARSFCENAGLVF